ncbi:MAG TPA: hypothetical protein VK473_05445 [Terriglobales bacterium]|nr:hypothetical protein [Terriglobales bacterium]
MRVIPCIATLCFALAALTGTSVAEQPAQAAAENTGVEAVAPSVSQDAQLLNGASGRQWTSLPPKSAVNYEWLYGQQPVCLTMHSLVVAREEGDSDSTRLVGQRTCTWSSRFQVKRTAPTKNVPESGRRVAGE